MLHPRRAAVIAFGLEVPVTDNGTPDNEWSVYDVDPTQDAPEDEQPVAEVIQLRPEQD